jgi:hypothetical protein
VTKCYYDLRVERQADLSPLIRCEIATSLCASDRYATPVNKGPDTRGESGQRAAPAVFAESGDFVAGAAIRASRCIDFPTARQT